MGDKDNSDFESYEFNIFSNFLSSISKTILEDILCEVVKLLEDSIIMDKTTNLEDR